MRYALPKNTTDAVIATMAFLFSVAGPALASGELPPEPLPPRNFAGFDSCLAYLLSEQQRQAAMAMPTPVAENGGTKQTLVQTKGVSKGPGEQAVYESEVGYENRSVDTETRSIVTNYSWERYRLACNGAAFSGTMQRGYDLPGNQPLPPDQKTQPTGQ